MVQICWEEVVVEEARGYLQEAGYRCYHLHPARQSGEHDLPVDLHFVKHIHVLQVDLTTANLGVFDVVGDFFGSIIYAQSICTALILVLTIPSMYLHSPLGQCCVLICLETMPLIDKTCRKQVPTIIPAGNLIEFDPTLGKVNVPDLTPPPADN